MFDSAGDCRIQILTAYRLTGNIQGMCLMAGTVLTETCCINSISKWQHEKTAQTSEY